jgi:DUF438 domain-containing protein
MEQQKTNELTSLLKRLNSGEDPALVREEAKNFLATINAADLSIAEQQLVEAGLEPEDLRHLCSVHMEMLSGELDRMKASLPEGHVIHTLVCEHDMILGFLDKLDETNNSIQKMASYDAKREEFWTLKHIAEHLVGAEPHHAREEEVLFPELESRGVSGPPQVMRLEHKDLRRYKHDLEELAESAGEADFTQFKKKLDATAKFIVLTLRDHIFKENNILYPTALQVISDTAAWDRLKKDCDKIGYCCFTPKS